MYPFNEKSNAAALVLLWTLYPGIVAVYNVIIRSDTLTSYQAMYIYVHVAI